MNPKEKLRQKALLFHELHYGEQSFILPNIWDPIGALMLEDLGYPAVATSSSAIAISHGISDGEKISFQEHLNQLNKIANCTKVPVSADIESGYASNDAQLEKNIRQLISIGVVGINIEDSNKDTHELVPIELQCHRIELITQLAKDEGIPLFINARIDSYVSNNNFSSDEKLNESIKRGKSYMDAGANCIFPILMHEESHICAFVKEISIPVNIMVYPGIPSLNRLNDIGVKRISLGGAFLRTSLSAMHKMAHQLKRLEGLEELTQHTLSSNYLQSLVEKNAANKGK